MWESEASRVQELAFEIELAGPAVDRVARHGQVDRSKVHADLVRAARLESYVEKRVTGQELPHLEVRDRLAWLVGVERVTEWVASVAPGRRVDPPGA